MARASVSCLHLLYGIAQRYFFPIFFSTLMTVGTAPHDFMTNSCHSLFYPISHPLVSTSPSQPLSNEGGRSGSVKKKRKEKKTSRHTLCAVGDTTRRNERTTARHRVRQRASDPRPPCHLRRVVRECVAAMLGRSYETSSSAPGGWALPIASIDRRCRRRLAVSRRDSIEGLGHETPIPREPLPFLWPVDSTASAPPPLV